MFNSAAIKDSKSTKNIILVLKLLMRQLEKMEIIYHSFPETRKQLYAEYKQKSLQMPNTRRVKQNLHVTGEHSSMSSNKAFNLAKLTLTYKVYST